MEDGILQSALFTLIQLFSEISIAKFEHLFNLFNSLPNDLCFRLPILIIYLSIFAKQTTFLTASYTAITTDDLSSNTPASDPQAREKA